MYSRLLVNGEFIIFARKKTESSKFVPLKFLIFKQKDLLIFPYSMLN